MRKKMYTESQAQEFGRAKTDVQCLPSMCRGLYHRVAQKVGCDASYVSRVARGERTSRTVSEALRAEIQLAWMKANDFANGAKQENSGTNGDGVVREEGATKIVKRKTKTASA
jgi:hypothetical protein